MKLLLLGKLASVIGATLIAEGLLSGSAETIVQAIVAVAGLFTRAPADDKRANDGRITP